MIEQSIAFADAALTGRLAFLDTGVANAQVRVYGSVRPAAGDPPGGPVLCAFVLEKPAGTVAAGVLTLLPAAFALVTNSGGPVWARVVNGDEAFAFDCDVGVAATPPDPDPDIVLSSSTLFAGGKVSLVSAVLG